MNLSHAHRNFLFGLISFAIAVLCLVPGSSLAQNTSATAAPTMLAVRRHEYGAAEVLHLERVARPDPGEHDLLVHVQAAGVNPLDLHVLRGRPWLMRLGGGLRHPQSPLVGNDFAGTVVAIGAQVTRFKVGDPVFGISEGTFAEYIA